MHAAYRWVAEFGHWQRGARRWSFLFAACIQQVFELSHTHTHTHTHVREEACDVDALPATAASHLALSFLL
mgnify:CR=1 FL=1